MVNKTVLLSGYFGFGNCGDEIIFSVLNRRLSEEKLNVISLLKSSSEGISFNRYCFKEIIKAVKQSDIIINGGGGLLQDKTSIKSLLYYLFVLYVSEKFGKGTTCFAQGIGPIRRRFGKFILSRILNRVDLITVRDSFSKGVLRESGVSKEVYVTADIAFLYDEEMKISLPYDQFILYSPGKSLNMPNIKTLLDIGNFIMKRTHLPLIIVPFYPEKDEEIAFKLSKELNVPLLIPERLAQYPYIVRKSSFVVGMRYHSVLLSILKHRAFVGLAYDPKVHALMDEANVKGIEDYGKMSSAQFKYIFSENFDKRFEIEELLTREAKDFENRAEENFELFKKEFLNT